jgi:signal transduction histidine kinase/DNA-binding response OmpR family regulator
MSTLELADLAHAYGDESLDDLRKDAVRSTAFGLMGAGALVLLAIPLALDVVPRESWLIAISLAGVGILTRQTLAAGLNLAVAILAVGVSLVVVAAVHLYPLTPVVGMLCLVVIFTGAFLGWKGSLAAAFGETALLVALGHFEPNVISSQVTFFTLLFVWCSAPAGWLVSHPVETALNWSWYHYARALQMADELRDRQVTLGRVSKSLNETCEKLEQLNLELQHAREAADEARRLKAEFAAWVSHELRTPLNLIIGFSEMLDTSLTTVNPAHLPQGIREDVEVVSRNASHISALVDDILDLSQIDAQRMALQRETISLGQVVDEALSGMLGRFRAHQLGVTVEIPSELPTIYVDPTRVRQILINLLINAMRYTDEGGVTVSATRQENDVVVTVQDTGAGIAADDLRHVFDEFQQGSPRSGHRRGSGLGLTVSRRFVEMHGGSMWVESRLGEGSRFSFSIPLSDNVIASPFSMEPSVNSHATPSCPDGPRLIVFDDTGNTSKVLQRYLDDYVVLIARSVEDVVRIVEDGPVRALVVGSLRVREQWQRCQLVRADLPKLPVITCVLHTTHFGTESLPISDYLTKPITNEKLYATLRKLKRRLGCVVVTEDDPDMSRLLVRWIRSHAKSCKVLVARDGEECLSMVQERKPDAILPDLLMPKLDGYAVLENIRSDPRRRDVPVIVISARGDREERVAVSTLQIDHSPGLPVGVTMRCLKANLDYLKDVPAGFAAAPPGAIAG